MTSTLGLGVPIPKMLPVTGTWSLPFAAYFLFLSNRVSYERIKSDTYFGDKPELTERPSYPSALQLGTRAHANFAENVPLALLFAAVAELNGANRRVLHYALAALFALRVAHVEIGLRGPKTMGVGRPVGNWGNQAIVAGVAGYTAYLVKGYWGF